YAYDWLDRLVSAQGSEGSLSYSYDPVGNRLSTNDLTCAYNAMNELVSRSDGTTFTYDEMGSTLTRTKDDTWSYTYDARNQLEEVQKNQTVVGHYGYDGDGYRVEKTEWIEDLQEYHSTLYMYSGDRVIYEKNITTDQEAIYIYGTKGRIAKKVNDITDYYHIDHLKSTRLITDENGTVVSEVQYKPFGETGPEEESYLYTGKEKDSSGLYYFGTRYYDPEIGRFITRDPQCGQLADPQTFNRYAYCLNNPLKYIDPDGRDPIFYGDDDDEDLGKVWRWSQNVDRIAYVPVEIDYDAFQYYYYAVAIGICGFLIVGFLGPYLITFIKAIAAAGPEVASMAFDALESLMSWYDGLSLMGQLALKFFLKVVIAIIADLIASILILENICGIDLDYFAFGIIVTIWEENGVKEGKVAFFSGETYRWRLENGIYYVFIDGNWVQMPDGWKPGDPIPET
ncbi:MAG: RHS repeat-associated core domain-containing protein, partial [Candidatus Methanofastidiosia archaeon]